MRLDLAKNRRTSVSHKTSGCVATGAKQGLSSRASVARRASRAMPKTGSPLRPSRAFSWAMSCFFSWMVLLLRKGNPGAVARGFVAGKILWLALLSGAGKWTWRKWMNVNTFKELYNWMIINQWLTRNSMNEKPVKIKYCQANSMNKSNRYMQIVISIYIYFISMNEDVDKHWAWPIGQEQETTWVKMNKHY